MWLAGGRWVRFGVVRLAGSVLRRSGCAVRSGGSHGCPLGCPPLWPVPWSHVLCESLSLGVCRVLSGGVAWSPRVCRVLSHPVPLPPCRPSTLVSRLCPLPPPVSVPLRLCGAPCSGRWPGSSPGGLGAVVGCAVLSVVPSVGVPPSPCAATGGRWARPGVVRACQVWAAVARLGGRAPLGWSALGLGVAVSLGGPAVSTGSWGTGRCRSLWCGTPPPAWCVSWCPLSCPFLQCCGPCPFLFQVSVVLRWFVAPVLFCPRCPVPVGACLLTSASPCPRAAGRPFALSLSGVLVVGLWRGLWKADGPCPGVHGLEPPAEGFGGVGVVVALDRVAEEAFACPLWHGGRSTAHSSKQQRSTAQHGTAQHSTQPTAQRQRTPDGTKQPTTAHSETAQHRAPRRSTAANGAAHDNTAQRQRARQSTQQGAAARGNRAQHHTTREAQEDTAQHDTARRTRNNTTQQAATEHRKAQNKPAQRANTRRHKATAGGRQNTKPGGEGQTAKRREAKTRQTETRGRQGAGRRHPRNTNTGVGGESRRRQQTAKRRRATTRHIGNKGKRGPRCQRPQNK